MTSIDLRHLYHGLVDRDLPYVHANGVVPSGGGSFWCVYEFAEWWAWVRHYQGAGNPVVLKVPLSRFDPKFLRPDDTASNHPLMPAYEEHELDIEEIRDRARQLCHDSMILCGGVRYEGVIYITNDDVITVVNKTEYR